VGGVATACTEIYIRGRQLPFLYNQTTTRAGNLSALIAAYCGNLAYATPLVYYVFAATTERQYFMAAAAVVEALSGMIGNGKSGGGSGRNHGRDRRSSGT
jgi:hypothetical protein